MRLIGFILNLAALTAGVLANHHDSLTLSPAEHSVVRYTNESLIVQCRAPSPQVKLHWKSPRGEIISANKGRIHIEQTSPEQLQIVFAHIALADKGNWSCEAVEGGMHSKSYELIVYQKITFTETNSVTTVKEGQNATILCEVKGEPQPNVTWHFNGQPISAEANASKFRILADALLIKKVTQFDTGEYTCRAFQVNSIASDMQERTVLMKIEHKPQWIHTLHTEQQYAYINGTAIIECKATAEPPPTFSWYRKQKRLESNEHTHLIETQATFSRITIHVHDAKQFDNYRCRVHNHLGTIERVTRLEQGEKPPPPTVFQLRGYNSNTFDVDVSAQRDKDKVGPMDVNGFRIQYITEPEFKADANKWTNAKHKDFPYEEGASLLITNLEPDTEYLIRAASRNLAGFSDYTKVTQKRTLSLELRASAGALLPSLYQLLTATLLLLLLRRCH
ncbi:limbic system-associated membrane protein [Drosophila sulfurigaster albostrigata]|uniref:limbic system-associated membrane protein n=1 Tax=Drosophila sulfurigaster albostrigata TaxID=89887 RepID=UPI002D219F2F|nr:limbic system-associated membrane protein [Drosophila sulfurigaster albostrigata]